MKQLPSEPAVIKTIEKQEAFLQVWLLKKNSYGVESQTSEGAVPVPVPVPVWAAATLPSPPTLVRQTPKGLKEELTQEDLLAVKNVLNKALFGPANWSDLGLNLGLIITTLNVIGRSGGDAYDHLETTLMYCLQHKDRVTSMTWNILVQAVKSTGDRAAADRIPGVVEKL